MNTPQGAADRPGLGLLVLRVSAFAAELVLVELLLAKQYFESWAQLFAPERDGSIRATGSLFSLGDR